MARLRASSPQLLPLLLLPLAAAQQPQYGAAQQQPINSFQFAAACPDYTLYSSYAQYVVLRCR